MWPKGIKVIYGFKNKGSDIQSILFDKKRWVKEQAKRWLKDHGFLVGEYDEGGEYMRFRQKDPRGYKRFRTSNPHTLIGPRERRHIEGMMDSLVEEVAETDPEASEELQEIFTELLFKWEDV